MNREEKLLFYSPYSFLRSISKDKQLAVVDAIFEKQIGTEKILIQVEGYDFIFYLRKLEWDTRFFNKNTFKLLTIISDNNDLAKVSEAIRQLLITIPKDSYVFTEVPSEDILFLQGLGNNCFKLLETRLTYYNDNIKNYEYKRFKVREAVKNDIEILQYTASVMKNEYDRIHADYTFDEVLANNYLAKYVENSIKGFADIVIVPDEEGVPIEAFLTSNFLTEDWDKVGVKISKMVLSAVNTSCRGWYVKLISEMTFIMKEKGVQCIFMNTQSTNKAVIKTWETLGFKYGSATHILSLNT